MSLWHRGAEHSVRELVSTRVLFKPIDGNHGELHPKKSDLLGKGVPFIMARDLKSGNVDLDSCSFISPEQAHRLRKGFAKAGDVLLSHKGTVGRTAIVGRLSAYGFPYIVLTPQVTYYRVADPSQLNPRYLRFYFDSPYFQAILKAWSQKGATRAYLGITAQLDLPVLLPPLETQRRIADILSAYDDLIENNERRMALLEEAIHLLYREWFVYLRFPGHERVEVVDGIPEGWRRIPIGELLTLQRGFDLPKKARTPGIVPVMASTGQHGTHDRAQVHGPGVVTGRSGSLGVTKYIHPDFWPLNTTLWVRKLSGITMEYAYCLLGQIGLESFRGGAAVPTLNRNAVHAAYALLPPGHLVEFFTAYSQRLLRQIDLLAQKNQHLREARDLLLPRLMNGSIPV